MAKYIGHQPFRTALRNSGHRHLYEDSPTDDIWGWRYEQDYSGKNLLGRALMQIRAVTTYA